MAKLPAIQFYPGDWLRDNIAGCTLAAQGLWLRMMILAHDSERYGYLCMNGSAMPPDFIARKCGSTLAEYERLLSELDTYAIPSRTPEDIIYSRRMVRDAKLRSQANDRQKRHRSSRSSNGDVTHPSRRSSLSSSSSTSPSGSGASSDNSDAEKGRGGAWEGPRQSA